MLEHTRVISTEDKSFVRKVDINKTILLSEEADCNLYPNFGSYIYTVSRLLLYSYGFAGDILSGRRLMGLRIYHFRDQCLWHTRGISNGPIRFQSVCAEFRTLHFNWIVELCRLLRQLHLWAGDNCVTITIHVSLCIHVKILTLGSRISWHARLVSVRRLCLPHKIDPQHWTTTFSCTGATRCRKKPVYGTSGLVENHYFWSLTLYRRCV